MAPTRSVEPVAPRLDFSFRLVAARDGDGDGDGYRVDARFAAEGEAAAGWARRAMSDHPALRCALEVTPGPARAAAFDLRLGGRPLRARDRSFATEPSAALGALLALPAAWMGSVVGTDFAGLEALVRQASVIHLGWARGAELRDAAARAQAALGDVLPRCVAVCAAWVAPSEALRLDDLNACHEALQHAAPQARADVAVAVGPSVAAFLWAAEPLEVRARRRGEGSGAAVHPHAGEPELRDPGAPVEGHLVEGEAAAHEAHGA